MTKQEAFLRDVIFPFVPRFQDPAFQAHYLDIVKQFPKSINVEHLTEIALATVGGYNFIDTEAKDFDDIDQSDSKTASILFSSKQIYLGSIGKKIGALRISIFNPYHNKVDFMFMPYGQWQRMAKSCHGENTEGKLRLIMSYNSTKDSYNQYERFRLSTFTELAKATSAEFYEKYPYLLDQEVAVPSRPTNFDKLFDLQDSSLDPHYVISSRTDPIQGIASLYSGATDLFGNPIQPE